MRLMTSCPSQLEAPSCFSSPPHMRSPALPSAPPVPMPPLTSFSSEGLRSTVQGIILPQKTMFFGMEKATWGQNYHPSQLVLGLLPPRAELPGTGRFTALSFPPSRLTQFQVFSDVIVHNFGKLPQNVMGKQVWAREDAWPCLADVGAAASLQWLKPLSWGCASTHPFR